MTIINEDTGLFLFTICIPSFKQMWNPLHDYISESFVFGWSRKSIAQVIHHPTGERWSPVYITRSSPGSYLVKLVLSITYHRLPPSFWHFSFSITEYGGGLLLIESASSNLDSMSISSVDDDRVVELCTCFSLSCTVLFSNWRSISLFSSSCSFFLLSSCFLF